MNIIPQAVDNSYIANMVKLAQELRFEGVEPNQIFMLMFSESINQSIISDSSLNYEERILGVYLFVAEEIYENYKSLHLDGVFSSKDLTIDILKKLK